jgi:acetyl-CoA synthetase
LNLLWLDFHTISKGKEFMPMPFAIGKDDTDEELIQEIKDTVRKIIGPIAKPDEVQIVPGLPKTRSGKIMRRILRKVASKDISNLGDTSTLLNPEIVDQIINGAGIKNY